MAAAIVAAATCALSKVTLRGLDLAVGLFGRTCVVVLPFSRFHDTGLTGRWSPRGLTDGTSLMEVICPPLTLSCI
jgi:hypothetical protein